MGGTEASPATLGQAGGCSGEDGCSWGAPEAPPARAGSRSGSFTNCIHPPPRTVIQMTAPGRWVLLMGTARLGAERRVSGPGLKGHQQKRAPWGDKGRNFSLTPAFNPSAAQGQASGALGMLQLLGPASFSKIDLKLMPGSFSPLFQIKNDCQSCKNAVHLSKCLY